MVTVLTPHLDVLPLPQQRLWDELIDIPEDMVLYGGTAIALHLGHRQSVDFDFFASTPFETDELIEQIPFLRDAEVLQQAPNTLTCLVDRGGPVKVSFFAVPRIGRVEEPLISPDINLRVASLLHLTGMKANVVQLRSEAKDYIDIAALIAHGINLPSALAAGALIYGQTFNPQNVLKALSYYGDGDLPSLPARIRDLLRSAILGVDLDNLPQLTPVPTRSSPRRPGR